MGMKLTFSNSRRIFLLTYIYQMRISTFQVKVAALQCLVKIVSLYYEYMEAYMAPALFAVSFFSNHDIQCFINLSKAVVQLI